MALALSYAFVLAAETLGRMRAVVCPDARSFRKLSFRMAPVIRQFSFPATRMERTWHELGKKKATRMERTVTKNSVSEMFCFNNTIRCFNTNFLTIISQSSQTYLGL